MRRLSAVCIWRRDFPRRAAVRLVGGDFEVVTSSISHQDLSDLIGRIYDCTLDPARWEATLDAMRSLLQTATAQLALVDLSEPRIILDKALGMDAEMLTLLSKHFPEVTKFVE